MEKWLLAVWQNPWERAALTPVWWMRTFFNSGRPWPVTQWGMCDSRGRFGTTLGFLSVDYTESRLLNRGEMPMCSFLCPEVTIMAISAVSDDWPPRLSAFGPSGRHQVSQTDWPEPTASGPQWRRDLPHPPHYLPVWPSEAYHPAQSLSPGPARVALIVREQCRWAPREPTPAADHSTESLMPPVGVGCRDRRFRIPLPAFAPWPPQSNGWVSPLRLTDDRKGRRET